MKKEKNQSHEKNCGGSKTCREKNSSKNTREKSCN